MNKETFALRREKLRRLMYEEGLDALLVSQSANRFYLSGFELHDCQCNESSGCLIIMKDGKDWLCTDSRYEEAAGKLWDRERIFIYHSASSEALNGLLKKLCGASGVIGIEEEHLSLGYARRLEPGLSLKGADGLVEKLREIKDEEEIRRIDASVKLNHRMLDWLPSVLVPGQDEASVAWAIEKFYRENGASELSFPSIVAMNANAALPHYAPEQPAVFTENCMVLVDEGCRLNQYCSDQTRTCWIGDRPEPRFTEMLERVQEAQRRAIAALRPGVTGREVHQIAVDYFASCGMDRYFTHSLGHGVGLETHEGPRLSIYNTSPLQPGMVVTIEPGLYFPGWGGARWEYMAVITEDGCRVF
ncbi:Xaa-Pro peptidase family protein [uncultured Mailhella sp.]|uniref:M24 family metallopeptidase n=1 Tax=uncultured Mailhella sp. TaxID=1981031 RepID=UPI0025F38FDD|nr:Xaa-Pro peptidase family protein [uncultured Mailhella sp.]